MTVGTDTKQGSQALHHQVPGGICDARTVGIPPTERVLKRQQCRERRGQGGGGGSGHFFWFCCGPLPSLRLVLIRCDKETDMETTTSESRVHYLL